ncbi:MAG TPA: DUF4012 domain-containing protein [Actinomycetota bacterium]|nr:DUF4012 domain-containing protein [Actinomycetota bacterium]
MTGVAVIIATLLGVWLWLAMLATPMRLAAGLLQARSHLTRAERALSATKLKEARYETLAGLAATRKALEAYDQQGPLFDLARNLSRVDGALDQVANLVGASLHSAAAAQGALDIAQNALRGPNKLIVKDPDDPEGGSRIRLERISTIGKTISNIRRQVRSAADLLAEIDSAALPRRARSAVARGIERSREADKVLADAEAGFALLPQLLGADGPRTYMLAMQNPAELRGTGGSLLQFALLTITDGSPELPESSEEERGTIYEIDKNRAQYDIPLPADAWYVAGVGDAQRAGNANWSPDWPLSAKLTVRYAQVADPDLPDIDGVILVDPIVLKNLLPGVGSFRTEQFSNLISEKNAVHYLLYKAYATHPIAAVRRKALGLVVDGFYERVLRPDYPTGLVDGMGRSLASKHMQIWLADPEEQQFLERMDWDGAIDEAKDSDYFSVVQQNVGGNKLNYFETQVHRTVVRIAGDDAWHETDVQITNGLFEPQTRYYMGDSGPNHKPMVNVYAPDRAQLIGWTTPSPARVDEPFPIGAWAPGPPEHLERGKKVWTATLVIPPRETGRLGFEYRVPDVVVEEDGRRVYRLVLQHQPKVRSETLIVKLVLPSDATDVKAPGWERGRNERVLRWERVLDDDQVLEVSWEP